MVTRDINILKKLNEAKQKRFVKEQSNLLASAYKAINNKSNVFEHVDGKEIPNSIDNNLSALSKGRKINMSIKNPKLRINDSKRPAPIQPPVKPLELPSKVGVLNANNTLRSPITTKSPFRGRFVAHII